MWHLICSGYLSYPLFYAKREISFEISTFGGSLFSGGSLLSGFANTCDMLLYFRRFATFEGSLLSELYGIVSNTVLRHFKTDRIVCHLFKEGYTVVK